MMRENGRTHWHGRFDINSVPRFISLSLCRLGICLAMIPVLPVTRKLLPLSLSCDMHMLCRSAYLKLASRCARILAHPTPPTSLAAVSITAGYPHASSSPLISCYPSSLTSSSRRPCLLLLPLLLPLPLPRTCPAASSPGSCRPPLLLLLSLPSPHSRWASES